MPAKLAAVAVPEPLGSRSAVSALETRPCLPYERRTFDIAVSGLVAFWLNAKARLPLPMANRHMARVPL